MSEDRNLPSNDESIQAQLESLARGEQNDPFHLLGPHPATHAETQGILVRTFLPGAERVWLIPAGANAEAVEMKPRAPSGFFEHFFPNQKIPFPYRLQMQPSGPNPAETAVKETVETTGELPIERIEIYDPYRFPPVLSEFDLYLIGEGTHQHLYEKLGARPMELEGVAGVHFAVWAPNATGVRLLCNLNGWDGRAHPFRTRGISGVWELFVPGLGVGEHYKYEIHSHSEPRVQQKSDPVGFHAELRPRTASIVWPLNGYEWSDGEWMERRAKQNVLEDPLSVYEVHLGSWKRNQDEDDRFPAYREMARELAPYVAGLGFTHIELMPLTEHPFDDSWGYQTVGYFAPTSRFGTPEDLKYLIDTCHQAGLGVILDWVPGHFPNDWHGLMQFDGTHLYEHSDPRKGQHPEWGTLIFNYGRNEVRGFLLSNALYWLEQFHVDGLRVDGVASMLYLDYARAQDEWVPNIHGGRENLEAVSFLQQLNTLVHRIPGVFTVAEESTAWPGVTRPVHLGGLGFTLKWNLGWMHDTLQYMGTDPLFRKYHPNLLTFVLLYAFTENFILPLSHDEVVHGKGSLQHKMPGNEWERFAGLRLLYGYMYAQPGKKLLFMGSEFGQSAEWDCNRSLDWWLLEFKPHRSLQSYVRDLNRLYRENPALHEVDSQPEGFEWIDFQDWEQSVLCFIRRGKDPDDHLVFAFNFTPVPRQMYRVGFPEAGTYREILNSDSQHYGGRDFGNFGSVHSIPVPWHAQPCSVVLTLPPMAMLVFKKADRGGDAETAEGARNRLDGLAAGC